MQYFQHTQHNSDNDFDGTSKSESQSISSLIKSTQGIGIKI